MKARQDHLINTLEDNMRVIEGQNDKCQFRFRVGFQYFRNQDPYFSITGETWDLEKSKTKQNSLGGGALDIGEYIPKLAYLQKYHLCSVKEPMYYFVNTLYFASERDHNGLLKGEVQQIKNGRTGELCWQRVARDSKGNEIELYKLSSIKDSSTKPDDEGLTISWEPYNKVGEGKAFELDAARRSAIWPDAQPEDFTEERLKERLPALMAQFKADVLKAGIDWPEGY